MKGFVLEIPRRAARPPSAARASSGGKMGGVGGCRRRLLTLPAKAEVFDRKKLDILKQFYDNIKKHARGNKRE